jgi:triphosphatase
MRWQGRLRRATSPGSRHHGRSLGMAKVLIQINAPNVHSRRSATFFGGGLFQIDPMTGRVRPYSGLTAMNPGSQEIELKLELPRASLPSIHEVPLLRALKRALSSTTEISVYFDTDRFELRKSGVMLRVRRIGNRYIQTVKATGTSGPFERGEWETEVAGYEPDLRLGKGNPLRRLVNGELRGQLKPIFETRIRRTVYRVARKACVIGLMVDRGMIDAGNRRLPLCEIELELERGSVTELFHVGRELIRVLPVHLSLKSKSERGYELLDRAQDSPLKAGAIDLPAKLNARDAFRMIGFACLKQVMDNAPGVIRRDPDAVHQMRVGLRRLRAAMSVFARLLRDSETAVIERELRWLANALGPARDLEVLINRVVLPMKQERIDKRIRLFTDELEQRHKVAVAQAQSAVKSTRFRALTFEVAAWLQAGRWTAPQDDPVRDRGDLQIAIFAAEQLTRRWRKLCKRRETLVQREARDLHRLRIQTKKLRYAVEFFGTLFATKQAKRRLKQLLPVIAQLQDRLGDLNDIATDEARLALMGVRRHANPNRVFAAGLLAGREDAQREAAMTAASKAYAELVQSKPFWQ